MSGNERGKSLITGIKKQFSTLSSNISKIANKTNGGQKEMSAPVLTAI